MDAHENLEEITRCGEIPLGKCRSQQTHRKSGKKQKAKHRNGEQSQKVNIPTTQQGKKRKADNAQVGNTSSKDSKDVKKQCQACEKWAKNETNGKN